MLVSGNVPVKSYQDVAAQKISTFGTREVSGFVSVVEEKKKQKAKIKYRKIKGSDCIAAPDGLPDNYYDEENERSFVKEVKQYLNIFRDKKTAGNFFLSGFPLDHASTEKYFSGCYLITEIVSPTPFMGAGTEAVQSLVEKSMLDDSTKGKVILFMSQIAPEDTSVIFFYKLGFRYVSESFNYVIKTAISKNLSQMQIPPAYMYLPQDNIPKLLRYGQLF